jgi:hypothetical protein
MRYLKPYKIFEADKPEYDTDWKRPGNPVREKLEVELREILLEVIDMGYRPQLSGFTKGFSESGPYVWICNQRRKSHDEFWNEITDTVERVKDYLIGKGFKVNQEVINEGTRNEQVYIYFNMSNLNESVSDTMDEINSTVENCKDILMEVQDLFGRVIVSKKFIEGSRSRQPGFIYGPRVNICCFYQIPGGISGKNKFITNKDLISEVHERLNDYMKSEGFTPTNIDNDVKNYFTWREGNFTYFIDFYKDLEPEFAGHIRYLRKYNLLNESFDDDADTMARYQLFGADTTMAFDFNREYITDVESIKDLIEKYNQFYVSGNSWSGGPPPKDFIEYFNKNYSKKGDASMKTWYPTIDLMIETLNYGTLILGFSIIDKSYKLINWGSLEAVGEYAGKDVAYDKRVLSEISKYINKELIDKLKLDEVVEILNLKIKNKVEWEWKE